MTPNPQLDLARKFIETTNKHIFLTGKAGTGKTTFLREIKETTFKRHIVVAPTGVAAINAKGVTIHSFFQIPFGPHLPAQNLTQSHQGSGGYIKMSKMKIEIIQSLDLLIIDEISMVRADLLDAMDEALRRYRKEESPFGGVQLLMIGDIQQLAPVVKDEEWKLLKDHYHTPYFFGSLALQRTDYVSIELKHIYRQNNQLFIDLLNRIRENQIDIPSLNILNQRHIPHFACTNEDGYITLTTHNHKANAINKQNLNVIQGQSHKFTARINGEFPEYSYPTDFILELKAGAQVMFVKNDTSHEKRFYNGKIGTIQHIDLVAQKVFVKCSDDQSIIEVDAMSWENCRFSINKDTKEIEEEVIGQFIQLPLKLAWAITIHKSQGLTFDRAIIDARDSFAHGQVYVALSRCRTLEGLVLSTPLEVTSIKADRQVVGFTHEIEQKKPDESLLVQSRHEFQRLLIMELFDFTKLLKSIHNCHRSCQQNASLLLSDYKSLFHQMKHQFDTQILQVSAKFHPQLSLLTRNLSDNENQMALQERISKAATYFEKILEQVVLIPLNETKIHTDNKKAKKEIQTTIDNLNKEVMVKIACLSASKEGFTVETYLKTKALTTIDAPGSGRKKSTRTEKSELNAEFSSLFESLRQWRDDLSTKKSVIPYQILHQKTLMEISQKQPTSIPALLSIKGIGKKKAIEYGPAIFEIIEKFCQKNNTPYTYQIDSENINPQAKKTVKADTRQITLDLYREGKTIDQIALERHLTVHTIENHLAFFISEGAIHIHDFVSHEVVRKVLETADKIQSSFLNPLMEALNHQYDFRTLKFALAYGRKKVDHKSDSSK